MPKDDPLSNEVSERLSKHTLWLNADNFNEMVGSAWEQLDPTLKDYFVQTMGGPPGAQRVWRAMCAAALAVAEWRLTGRVRP